MLPILTHFNIHATVLFQDRHTGSLKSGAKKETIDLFTLTASQARAVALCLEAERNKTPIRLIVYGTAGTGKTHLIKALKQECKGVCCMAPTAMAALLIDGITYQSAIPTPVNGQRAWKKLPSAVLSRYQHKLKDVQLLILDEFSMLSMSDMGWLDSRLREIRHANLPFGGFSIVFAGDFGQLPPCAGVPLFRKPMSDVPKRVSGRNMYLGISKVVILTKPQRTKNASTKFKGALELLRNGLLMDDSTDPVYTVLKERFTCNVDTRQFDDAVNVWYCRKPVRQYNHNAIVKLGTPIAVVNAVVHTGPTSARKADPRGAGNLESKLVLAVGARVMEAKYTTKHKSTRGECTQRNSIDSVTSKH